MIGAPCPMCEARGVSEHGLCPTCVAAAVLDNETPYVPDELDRLTVACAFYRCAAAGYGFTDGDGFEAIPGLEDAAADFIQQLLGVDGEEATS